jgi:hypothetical protein
MSKHYTRAGRGNGLFVPGEGTLTGRKKQVVDTILGEYAQPFARLERALASPDLTERQRQVLEQTKADLIEEARRRILVALQDLE